MKPSTAALLPDPGRPDPARRPDETLPDLLERLARRGGRGVVCHVHLSRLQPGHRREPLLRAAADAFAAAARRFEGICFMLPGGDVLVVARGATVPTVDGAVQELRFLFAQDPLAALGQGGFCTWYRIEADRLRLLGLARHLRELVRLSQPAPAPPLAPLDPGGLGRLQAQLEGTDLANVLRNRAVCALLPGHRPQPLLDEIHVSIPALGRAMAPGTDLAADPWLFQCLKRTLDRRLLAHLARDDGARSRPLAVQLGLATLLSPDFRSFDDLTGGRHPRRPTIALQPLDIFADLDAFHFARDLLRGLGYRLCLDGVGPRSLPHADRRRLGVDLVKLQWAPELAEDGRADLREEVRDYVVATGPTRVILAGCDDEAALAAGRALGIVLFQGAAVERRLRQGAPALLPRRA